MRKLLLALLLALLTAGQAGAELKIVATLTEIGALAEELGGERVSVQSLARGDEDPHAIAAKPSHSRRLSRADLLVYNGMELEIGWLPLLVEGARNPRVLAGSPGDLDLSQFIAPLEVPEHVDRSMGDVHPEGNPHYTVDPGLYPDLARGLSARLVELDPAGADYYAERLEVFLAHWERHMGDWTRRLEPLRGERLVAYHQMWAYPAARFGFEIAGHVEDRPGIPPTPRHLLELERLVESEGIRLLVYSDLVRSGGPERFAERAGCRALQLPQSLGSREGAGDLVSWFERWVAALETFAEED